MKKIHSNINYVVVAVLVLMLAVVAGCKIYFVAADFNTRTTDHKTIAVLPFEMLFTGVKPEKLTDADLQIIAEAESKAFMISFYNELLRSTRSGRKPLRIDVQHYDKTLNILKTNNIDIQSAWKKDPEKLATLLGVEAIVKARIEKHRLMSDLASYGIDLGIHILSVLSDYSIWFWLPPGITKAKEIKSSYTLFDKKGTTLWSIAYDYEADWTQHANDIIDNINRKAARHFPYRNK